MREISRRKERLREFRLGTPSVGGLKKRTPRKKKGVQKKKRGKGGLDNTEFRDTEGHEKKNSRKGENQGNKQRVSKSAGTTEWALRGGGSPKKDAFIGGGKRRLESQRKKKRGGRELKRRGEKIIGKVNSTIY